MGLSGAADADAHCVIMSWEVLLITEGTGRGPGDTLAGFEF